MSRDDGGDPARGPPGDDAVTEDTLLRGRVVLYQPARGFRSSLDPVLLAAFLTPDQAAATVPPADDVGRFLDLGAGTGALSFLLLARAPSSHGVAVELQPRLAALLERGRARNQFNERLELISGDIREVARAWPKDANGDFDLVATNPPFRPLGRGVLSQDTERTIAHHEVRLDLPTWVAIATRLLRPSGRLGVIFPFERRAELVAALASLGWGVARERVVRPEEGRPPNRVLLEARPRIGSTVVEPDLVVHRNGVFTDEVREMVGERGRRDPDTGAPNTMR